MRYLTDTNPQGSELWLKARAGRATGSRAADILATIKSGEAAARRDYRLELAIERLTGSPAPQGFVSADMQWGTDNEPLARMAHEERTGCIVSESGFTYLPDIMAGCSVDGFIEENGRLGIAEFKCPKSFTHIGYIRAGVMPTAYKPQVIHNMWVTGAEFCDFVSFDPRLTGKLQLFTIRYERNESEIQEYEAKLFQFLAEVDEEHKQLLRLAA